MKTQISFRFLMKINVCSGNLSEIPFFVYFFVVSWINIARRYCYMNLFCSALRSLHGAGILLSWTENHFYYLFYLSKWTKVCAIPRQFPHSPICGHRDRWIKLKEKKRKINGTQRSHFACSYWQKFLLNGSSPLSVRWVQVNQFKRTLMQSSEHKIILFEWGWRLCMHLYSVGRRDIGKFVCSDAKSSNKEEKSFSGDCVGETVF